MKKQKMYHEEVQDYLPLNSTSNQHANPCSLAPTVATNLRGMSISYSSSSYRMKHDLSTLGCFFLNIDPI